MLKRRKPRALTLTLPNAKQPFFLLEGKRYTLRNLSEEGVGIWVPAPAPFGLVPGARVSGDVVIGNEIFAVGLEIRHVSQHVVGFRFLNAPTELLKIFQNVMEVSHYAASLVQNPLSGQDDKEMNAPRLVYSGDSHTELLVWFNESSRMVQAIQIRFLGRWVFRKLHEPYQTGYLRDDIQPVSGFRCEPKDLLVVHETPDIEIIHQAVQFLTSVPRPLPGALLWQFLEMGEQVYLPAESLSNSEVA